MLIHVTRDSVCMGDDVFDNSRDIEFDDNASIESIIPVLYERSFFPSVSGNDVMWVVENVRKERVLEYYTKIEKTEFKVSVNKPLKEVCGEELMLHCVYYANYRK